MMKKKIKQQGKKVPAQKAKKTLSRSEKTSEKKLPGKAKKTKTSTASKKNTDANTLRQLREKLAQKEKELRLRKKESQADLTRYHAIVDNCMSALILGKPDGTILEVNPAACKMFGYTQAEFLKIDRSTFIDTSSPEAQQKIKERRKNKKFTGEMIGIRKNGEHFPCEVTSVIFKNSDGDDRTSTAITDVSDRKKTEQSMLEANQHMQMILDNTDESFFVIDEKLNIISANKTAQDYAIRLTGKRFKTGGSILDLGTPDRKEALQKMYAHILDGNNYYYEYTLHSPNGEEITFGLRFAPVRIRKKIVAIMLNARNITKEKNAFSELKLQQQQLKDAENIAHTGSWEWNIITNILNWSDGFFRICGCEPQSFVPTLDLLSETFIHPEDREMLNKALKRSAETGQSYSQAFRIITKQGEIKHIDNKGQVVHDTKGKAIKLIGASHDITEKVLAEREKEFHATNTAALINSTNDLIWSIDKNKRLIIGNNSFLKFIEIHTGKKLTPGTALLEVDYFNSKELASWGELYEKVLSGNTFSVISSLDTKAGKIWSETWFDPIVENGEVLGAAMYSKNITDRKKLEDQNTLLVSIVNFSEDAIISKKLDGTITSWNHGAEKLFGYPASEAIGKNIYILVPEHLAGEEKQILAKISKGQHIEHYETVRRRKNGALIDISLTVSPISDSSGNVTGASKIARDISLRKKAEAQLKEVHLELEKRAEELSNSNTELEQFAYVVSHDLQEPLRMVTSFLQLLKKNYGDAFDETGNKYIHYAVDGADRMKSLILDLLQYSRAGTVVLEESELQMNELVNETLVLYRAENADFEVAELPVVQGSRTAMLQLLQNLIGNAVKYRSDKKIKIKIWSEELPTEWKFIVEDNGIGIEPRFFEKIFVVFQRLHNKDKYGGTGVGLAICKRIVERHKGRIWVESVPGEGSRFMFTLPKESK